VDRDIILLRGASEDYRLSEGKFKGEGYDIPGQRERVPLEVRNLGARKEDVLTSPGCGLLLLDLNLHNVGRMLDNLGDVCIMTRANFAEDTLRDPNDTSNEPIALYTYQQYLSYRKWKTYPEHTDCVGRAVRGTIRLNHTKHAVELPTDEKDNEKVVGIPEPLESRPTDLFSGEENHDTEGSCHDPTSGARAGGEVGSEESNDTSAGCGCRNHGKFVEVDHVSKDMNYGTSDDGPCRCLVKGDVLVERDDVVQWGASEH
jgi:hypothetical protein